MDDPTLDEPRELRALLRRYQRERQLIAYELHDGLVQDITGAQLHLEALLGSGQVPAGPLRESLDGVLGLIRKAAGGARQFVDHLRPPGLELGLAKAIECLIADQPPGGPSIQWDVQMPPDQSDPLLEGTIYRIIRESLTNLRRHSRSDRARIRLTQLGDQLELEIQDWGVGFDPAAVEPTRLGLRGIRERARLLGGRALVDSAPGKGTRVLVHLPRGVSRNYSLLNDRSCE